MTISKLNLYTKVLTAIAALIAIKIYFLVLVDYAPNIPIFDDFEDIIPFILSYVSPTLNITDKAYIVIEQHNDHIIAFSRIIYILLYEITGKINFFTITIIGNASLILLSVIYYFSIKKDDQNIVVFSTTIFLLYQISCYKAATFPMTVISNYWVLAFALSSLYFLNKESLRYHALAILFAFIAVFTLASGQLVLLAGLFLLIIKNIEGFKKPPTNLLVLWSLSSLIILYLFYSGVEKRFGNNTAKQVLNDLDLYIIGFVKLIGSPYSFDNEAASGAFGVMGLTIHCFLTYKKAWKNYTIFSFSIFILMALATISLTRAWAGHNFLITADRYVFIAINYWICLLILTTSMLGKYKKNICFLLMIITLALNIYSYIDNRDKIRELHFKKIDNMRQWTKSNHQTKLLVPNQSNYHTDQATPNMEKLIHLKLYLPPI